MKFDNHVRVPLIKRYKVRKIYEEGIATISVVAVHLQHIYTLKTLDEVLDAYVNDPTIPRGLHELRHNRNHNDEVMTLRETSD